LGDNEKTSLPYAAMTLWQTLIRTGVKANLDARRVMMAGLHREVFSV